MRMCARLRPVGAEELSEHVTRAARDGYAIEACGGGSKRNIGSPDRKNTVIDLGAMTGVVDYEPSELVLTVRPATPLAEVEHILGEQGQMLAFEPWDHGAIFRMGKRATIGGTVAAGVAGPRRVSAGGARDHLLGFEAVSGRGELFKAGGRVVKNVTGYDVSKVIAGSWGQLAIMTQLSLKVLPRPRAVVTTWIKGLTADAAVRTMASAMGSPCAVAAAAHVPAISGRPAATAFRLEGFAESVAARVEQLAVLLSDHGACTVMTQEDSVEFWEAVATAKPFAEAEALWRAHVSPSRVSSFTTALDVLGASYLLDWAGAALWIGANADCEVRATVAALGGHAMLVRAPDAMRSAIPARHPEPPGVAALSTRIKRAFDPAGILDPRRFS
jgi:glycolate oxidase FAD binding subunit